MTPTARFQPELSDAEWDLILGLLDAKRSELPTEIHHTHRFGYRDELRRRLDLIENLIEKLKPLRGAPAVDPGPGAPVG